MKESYDVTVINESMSGKSTMIFKKKPQKTVEIQARFPWKRFTRTMSL